MKGEKITDLEAKRVDNTATATNPLGGKFEKGTLIRKVTEDTVMPCINGADPVVGVVSDEVVFPYTNKNVGFAYKKDDYVYIQANSAVLINAYLRQSDTNFTRVQSFVPNLISGGTQFQQIGIAQTAAAAAGDWVLVKLDIQVTRG